MTSLHPKAKWISPPPIGVKVPTISVEDSSVSRLAGAREIMAAFRRETTSFDDRIYLRGVGSFGVFSHGVMTDITLPGYPRVLYGNVSPREVSGLVKSHILENRPDRSRALAQIIWGQKVRRYPGIPAIEDLDCFRGETRLVTRRLGLVDPDSLSEYREAGGYRALDRCLTDMTPSEVIEIVERSGLQGRGGGGFPAGIKWRRTASHKAATVYVAAVTTEADPGAFMHHCLLEGDPHGVLEGMIIAAYAVGARQGFFVVNPYDRLILERFRRAAAKARSKGLLGKNILGTSFSFDLEIREGGGAFIEGEETALIAFLEGKRASPRSRPPFPADQGFNDRPTLINNIETLAAVPFIINKGPSVFRSFGTDDSPGTKTYWLSGSFVRKGLVEVPLGTPIKNLIQGPGNGASAEIKAVHVGGILGQSYPVSLFSLPLTYKRGGAIVGSGGVLAVDSSVCMVELARSFLQFALDEACGGCTPGRVGTQCLFEILGRLVEGKGSPRDLLFLSNLGRIVSRTSLCGLGRLAPRPVLSGLTHFWEEYLLHGEGKKCPAADGKAR